MKNFSDLFKYYKDCLFEDSSDAIFAEIINNQTTYVRINGVELSLRNPVVFTEIETSEIQSFISDTLLIVPSASFWYGYPTLYIQGYGRRDDFIKPIFYIPLKLTDEKGFSIDAKETPRINSDAFEKLGIEKEQTKRFAESNGLNSDQVNDINFTLLATRLREAFPQLTYEVRGSKSIFFRGAIFNSDQSNTTYTKGLDKDLSELIRRNITKFEKSCLSCFLENPEKKKSIDKDIKVLEVFDLNKSQLKVVLSALNNRLTVVQGPPGTGKSQVVASIILNAMLLKQKVLFSSKNHKAIQVVEAKFKKFHDKPFFIQLGNKDGLPGALNEYLNWLYTNMPPAESIQNKDKKRNLLDKSILDRTKIENEIEDQRKRRNIILNLLGKTEGASWNPDGEELTISPEKITEIKEIRKKYLLNKRIKIAAKYQKAINSLHCIKSLEALLDELDAINKIIQRTSGEYARLMIDCQPLELDESNRTVLHNYIGILHGLTAPGLTDTDRANLYRRRDVLQGQMSNFLHAWCVTNLSIHSQLPLDEGFFDLVVIDEASQCDIASVIPLLFRAKRVVVLGDPNQLKHITTMGRARSIKLRSDYSIEDNRFDYVTNSFYDLSEATEKKGNIIKLDEHFRSHSDIISFSKDYWYEGKLTISTDYRNLHPATNSNEHAVQWIDTGIIVHNAATGTDIPEEIDKVVTKAIELIKDENFIGNIGIVTPFRSQANGIRSRLDLGLDNNERIRILVETAVKFQGDEKDIIIFSPVVSDNMQRGVKYYYQETGNLLNVAITRARSKLIVIGDRNACLNLELPHIQGFAQYVENLMNGAGEIIEQYAESIYEAILHKALREAGINPTPQYVEGQYRLDFAVIIGEFKLNIEVDGKQFHTDWTGERLKSDILRNQRLQNLGWKVIRFWSYEIRDKLDYCVNRIKAEIGS